MRHCFKALLIAELFAIIGLQMSFWSSDEGIRKVWQLEQEIASERALLHDRTLRNQLLSTEVEALKQDSDALEEKARLDLGLIQEGETFFHLVD